MQTFHATVTFKPAYFNRRLLCHIPANVEGEVMISETEFSFSRECATALLPLDCETVEEGRKLVVATLIRRLKERGLTGTLKVHHG
jgi:hypothetical protein